MSSEHLSDSPSNSPSYSQSESPLNSSPSISTLEELARFADYSLMERLNQDPDASETGDDYMPRQVFSGHYVPVKPTPIADPLYIAHSKALFNELGLADGLSQTQGFRAMFSGDLSSLPSTMRKYGWATGYALSIYGTEYTQQCPFRTGNGYGDGRAVSVLEVLIDNKRWEMQLKGGGRTPYCRGADGRAVLRSSVREFLAQEHMHALGVPTSRSLSLFVSESETVDRPWYSEGSEYADPDIMVSNPVAITTRVASSFLRVGQLELFGRRARSQAHPEAMKELEMIVKYAIEREYPDVLKSATNEDTSFENMLLMFATDFRERLMELVTNWIRVGYCQGNFNSDNCAVGGFTLDYGPFGFCERFEPFFQPWTGGGRHFSFLNQPAAAKANFEMFCKAMEPLLQDYPAELEGLKALREGFAAEVKAKQEAMWAAKLGLESFDAELFSQLLELMIQTSVDYTMFFRELSSIPDELSDLEPSFYEPLNAELTEQWQIWLAKWRERLSSSLDPDLLSQKMKRVNPKYTWREWLVVPAYQQAAEGDFSLIHELQQVLGNPYDEQSEEVENKYYRLRPKEYFQAGGVSHYSCSS